MTDPNQKEAKVGWGQPPEATDNKAQKQAEDAWGPNGGAGAMMKWLALFGVIVLAEFGYRSYTTSNQTEVEKVTDSYQGNLLDPT